MPYEMTANANLSSHINFSMGIEGWIIIGNYKSDQRAFKVTQMNGRIDLTGNKLVFGPEISITGRWSNNSGHKWSSRTYYWNWNNESITFHTLPTKIKEHIYSMIETASREFLLQLHSDYKEMTAARGFKSKNLPVKDSDSDEELDVFMPSVAITPGKSKWEDMDVSQWAIARKELGLPKPPRKPRTRKAKVVV